jgi:pyruvate ferredoxin oxidoreductase gamma subunit
MIEIRFHGRGGQGAVTAAELLARAAIGEKKYAQGFPNFGAERRGAPVTAYLRVSGETIYLRENIHNPDMVVVMDQSLAGGVDVCEGLGPGGTLVVNTPSIDTGELPEFKSKYRLAIVDANAIAKEVLGVFITNTAIIGAVLRATSIVNLESLEAPFRHRFGKSAEKNLLAMRRAYQETRIFEAEEAGASVRSNLEPASLGTDSWPDVALGGDIVRAGSSADFQTGNWRTATRPVTSLETCVKCGLCWILCPDMAYSPNDDGFFSWDARYCKGCGICAQECPKGAIEMRSEK